MYYYKMASSTDGSPDMAISRGMGTLDETLSEATTPHSMAMNAIDSR